MPDPSDVTIPFHRPFLGEEEVEAAAAVIRSGWLTTGPVSAEFERAAAAYLGGGDKSCAATTSGTSAMTLALLGIGISQGDEVITTPYTFAATAQAITAVGAVAIFADIDLGTGNLCPAAAAAAITARTKAIVVVHVGGHPAEMAKFVALAQKHDLKIIEDAAHAFETKSELGAPGTKTAAACFSFYASKNLTMGEGGMVCAEDPKLIEELRSLRNHGLDRDSWSRDGKSRPWAYDLHRHGLKVNPSDVLSAIGLVQLGRVETFQAQRRELVAQYREGLADLECLELPADPEPENSRHAWHLFSPRFRDDESAVHRDDLLLALGAEGIQTSVHFKPLHEMSIWRKEQPELSFPIAEARGRSVFSLPLFPGLKASQVDRVITCLRKQLDRRSAKGSRS
ncbi:MAG: DegT/DnrJ/EryC1/StrS family aminotransferase [Planctomycetota bacterium]